MDSSVINYIGSKACKKKFGQSARLKTKKKFGQSARLKTFALGVGESEDIHSARLVASHIDSEHHEFLVDLNQILEVLPEVIYYLESFDPSLVRSSVSNYLISRYAKEHGIQILLSLVRGATRCFVDTNISDTALQKSCLTNRWNALVFCIIMLR